MKVWFYFVFYIICTLNTRFGYYIYLFMLFKINCMHGSIGYGIWVLRDKSVHRNETSERIYYANNFSFGIWT